MVPDEAVVMPVIDVNVEVGARVPVRRSTQLSDVLAVQQRFGIGHSLVRSASAVGVDRQHGNAQVLQVTAEAGAHGKVSAVAAATLLHLDELIGELRTAAREGARAVWVSGREPWSTPSEAHVKMFAIAAEPGLPLFVPHRQWADTTAIGQMTQHLGVPVVLFAARYPEDADTYAALERFEHLHIETSTFGSFDAFERMVAVVGAERIMFGSGEPVHTARSPLNALMAADLSSDDRQLIAGGNAARLLGIEVEPTSVSPFVAPDRLFDVHGHFFPAPWPVPLQDYGPPVRNLRRFGIERHVASSIPAIMGDLEGGNAQTVAGCREEPGQLGYLVADARDPLTAREHLERWGRSEGIVGVKVHTEGSGVLTTDRAMARLFDVLADFGLPVKIHNHGPGWEDALMAIAQTHPRLPIIVAHAGYHRPQPSVGEVVNRTDNVHIELASSKAETDDARALVGMVSLDRVLFGADAPLLNPAWVLGLYDELGLSDAELAQVQWANGVRVFGQ